MKLSDIILKIFAERSKLPEYRIYKHRYGKGLLSIEKQESILHDNGYTKIKEAAWKKIVD